MLDICFPEDNEDKFVEIAKKLNTEGLVFIYNSPEKLKEKQYDLKVIKGLYLKDASKKKGKTDIYFSHFPAKVSNDKRICYFYEGEEAKRTFHYPILGITQVNIKELRDTDKDLCISFNSMLRYRNSPQIVERYSLVIKLCDKYKVKAFLASFARNPYELRAEKELGSVASLLGLDRRQIGFSARFL